MCDLTGDTDDRPLGSPQRYQAVVEALAAMGTGCMAALRCGGADSLAVRPTIAKPRATPNHAAARRLPGSTAARKDDKQQKRPLVPPAVLALYFDGANAIASWPQSPAPPASFPLSSDALGACGPMCATRLGAVDCDGLDPVDIEGSLRLRLASVEESFEHQAATRLVAALDRMVASGAVRAVAFHRPVWSRPACLACTAASAPSRPSPVRAIHRRDAHTGETPSSSSASLLRTDDVAVSISALGSMMASAGSGPFGALVAVCVYSAMRADDGTVAWTVRRRTNTQQQQQRQGLAATSLPSLSSTTMVAMTTGSLPPSKGIARCARCIAGTRIKGVASTAPEVGTVSADAGEVVGALAANLWEGVAGTVVSIGAGPDYRYRTLWSGVPGERPASDLLDAAVVPSTTWLAAETQDIAADTARRRPSGGADALYTCARVAYAAARLADVTARQRAVHAHASCLAIGDPRRVRPAAPVVYGPAMDSALTALAWMRGAASLFGSVVDTDSALSAAASAYRMHVLARDLERTPLAPLDPSRLPDEVRDLARQLRASVRSLDNDDDDNTRESRAATAPAHTQ